MTLSDRTRLHQPFRKSNKTLNFNPSFLALIVLPQSEAYHCAEFHHFRLRTSCSQTDNTDTRITSCFKKLAKWGHRSTPSKQTTQQSITAHYKLSITKSYNLNNNIMRFVTIAGNAECIPTTTVIFFKFSYCLQCFDTVEWASEEHLACKKTEW